MVHIFSMGKKIIQGWLKVQNIRGSSKIWKRSAARSAFIANEIIIFGLIENFVQWVGYEKNIYLHSGFIDHSYIIQKDII